MLVDIGNARLDVTRRQAPGKMRRLTDKPRRGAVEHHGPHALGVGCGEQDAHRPALGDAKQRRAPRVHGVEHGLQVVHAFIQRRNASYRIGESCPALVPDD
jgi:hypothetical protein